MRTVREHSQKQRGTLLQWRSGLPTLPPQQAQTPRATRARARGFLELDPVTVHAPTTTRMEHLGRRGRWVAGLGRAWRRGWRRGAAVAGTAADLADTVCAAAAARAPFMPRVRTRRMSLTFAALVACSDASEPGTRNEMAGRDPHIVPDSASYLIYAPARCSPHCLDLPEQPIFDAASSPPADAARYFGAADNFKEPGVCMVEPQLAQDGRPGSLFPRNWLRPRFRWEPLSAENLWEIRVSAMNQEHTLVAYTAQTSWKMPAEIWKGLTSSSADMPISVSVRGVNTRNPQTPSRTRGEITIAPAEARGKLVYWAATSSEVRPDTSKLAGFDVGDEGVIDVLTIKGVSDRGLLAAGGRELRGKYDDPRGVEPGHVQCIGCHVSTPDGDAVSFTDHWPWNTVLASIEEGHVGQLPSYVSPGAALLLNQPWLGMQTFSKAHFRAGDRVLISVYSPRNLDRGGVGFADGPPYPSHQDGLAWFDLETTASFDAPDPSQGDAQQQLNEAVRAQLGQAFGLIALQGETRSAAAPSFSHDGSRIVYTSADNTQDGRLSGNNSEVDLHVVPYNARQGGEVSPLAGAAEPGAAEYYPTFSADDAFVAFNRVAEIDGAPMYYRPDGEIYVVPAEGGQAMRLAANDPPACGGQQSPGVINSWPKWSPRAMTVATAGVESEFGPPERTFYWLVFSSARKYEGQFELPKTQFSPNDTRASQLYVTGLVRDNRSGELQSYAGIYLWNQDPSTSNLTPAWDEFKIPDVPSPD